jgi:hypothetical protein
MATEELVGVWVAAVLTLTVYSFLIRDNPLFRFAEHLLVGTALGYAALIVTERVLLPSINAVIWPVAPNPVSQVMTALGIVWGLLLFTWLARPARWLASWSLAIVFGVGAALAIGGALVGTLLPQVEATLLPLEGGSVLNNLVIVLLVLAGLTYFFFAVRRDRPVGRVIQGVSKVGRWGLMLALGSFLGARTITLLNALIERFQFLGRWLQQILP